MSRVYTGEVRNGVIVPDEGTPPLPEGTRLRFEVVGEAGGVVEDRVEGTRKLLMGWARRAEEVTPAMPSDLAEEHDHYAHGKPRS